MLFEEIQFQPVAKIGGFAGFTGTPITGNAEALAGWSRPHPNLGRHILS
jgi:hypothetical protein